MNSAIKAITFENVRRFFSLAITVYLAQAGGFSGGTRYGTNTSPNGVGQKDSILLGDFNQDGKPDLLTTGRQDPVRFVVYNGIGNGTFPQAADFKGSFAGTGSLAGTSSSVVADVNNDGKPDLVSGLANHSFAVALGNGTGGFTAVSGSPFNVPTTANSTSDGVISVAVGNFSGSPAADVATLVRNDTESGIYVAEGNGSGAFTPVSNAPVLPGNSGRPFTSIAGINLNGDGYTDLSITQPFSDVNVLDTPILRTMVGGPTGLKLNPDAGALDPGHDPNSQFVADMDGDGDQDLLVGLRAGQGAAVVLSDGAGGLSPAPNSPYNLPGVGISPNYEANGVASGDFNGDGFPDITSAMYQSNYANQGVDVLLSRPSPTVAPDYAEFPVTIPGQQSPPVAVTVANDPGSPPFELADVTPHDQFAIDRSACATPVPGGSSCTVSIAFTPESEGRFDRTLTFEFADGQTFGFPVLANTGEASAEIDLDSEWQWIEFGDMVAGYPPSYKTKTVTVTSSGTRDLIIDGVELGGDDAANYQLVDPGACQGTFGPGEKCEIPVKFTPVGTEPNDYFRSATLTIKTVNDELGPYTYDLAALTYRATHKITPTSGEFGQVTIGAATGSSRQFQISAGGTNDYLPLKGVSVSGPDAGDFRISSPPCDAYLRTLIPCRVTVDFKPASGSPGQRRASLDFDVFTTSDGPTSIPLTGTAVAAPIPPPPGKPKLSLRVSAPKKVKRGKALAVKVTVRNIGDATATSLVIKASAPKKLAAKAKRVKIARLAAGESLTRRIKVKVKRKARRGSKLKVKVSVSATGLAAKRAATRPAKIR